jgi:hypothetical protein
MIDNNKYTISKVKPERYVFDQDQNHPFSKAPEHLREAFVTGDGIYLDYRHFNDLPIDEAEELAQEARINYMRSGDRLLFDADNVIEGYMELKNFAAAIVYQNLIDGLKAHIGLEATVPSETTVH